MKLKKNPFRERKTLAELSLLSMALLAVSLVFAANSQVNEIPKVPISDFQIDRTEAKPGETIKGSFTIKNEETTAVNDISLRVGISKIIKEITPSSETVTGTLENDEAPSPIATGRSLSIGSTIVAESLTLKGEASLKKDFSFQLPENLSDGKHFLVVTSFSGRGDIFGVSEEKNINITGGGSFVSITDEKIISPEGREYSPGFGLSFDSNIAPKVKFKVKNYGGKARTTPQILIYKRAADDRNFIKKTVEKNITLEANEEKFIEMTLPALEKPMIYLADFRLLDDSGKQLSNLSSFRWAIKGLSPQIIKLNADKASYKKGESVVVDYAIVGSGDTEKRNENGALAIEMVDSKGRVAGNANETVSLDGDGKKVNIKLNRAVNGYTLRAKILKGEEALDSYEVKVAGEAEKSALPIYLAGLLVVVILIGGGAYMIKNKKSKLPKTIALFFLVSALSFLFSGKAFAERRLYVQTPTEATFNWSAPTNTVFTEGNTMHITGTVKMSTCSNELVSESYVIYFGRKSGGYASYSSQSFAGPLDSTASNNARISIRDAMTPKMNLGNLDGITYNYGGTAGLHYYHKDWTIPTNLSSDYLGKSDTYLMVIYKGDHINTSGTVVSRYRQLSVQQITINPLNYTLSYNGNGNTGGSAPGSNTVHVGTNVAVSGNTGSLSKTNYSFAGWNTNSAGTGTNYPVGNTITVNSNVTLYAKWTINTYTLSYNGNGNTGGFVPSSTTVNSGTNATISGNTGNLVKSGNRFVGWNTNSAGTGTNYSGSGSINMTGNVVLYARWTPVTLSCSLSAEPATGGTLPLTVAFTADPGGDLGSFSNLQYKFFYDLTDLTKIRDWNASNAATNVYTISKSTPYETSAKIRGTDPSGLLTERDCLPNPLGFKINPWSSGEQGEVAP